MILTILPTALRHLFEAFEAAGARNNPQYGAKSLVYDAKQSITNFRYHLRGSYEGVKVLIYLIDLVSETMPEERQRYTAILDFAVQQSLTVVVLTPYSLEGKATINETAREAADRLESAGVRHYFVSEAPIDTAHSWELGKEVLRLLESGWQGRMAASVDHRTITISPAGRKYDAHR